MILADASVWIDYFRGDATPPVRRLRSALVSKLLLVGDLTLTEVLQGFGRDREYRHAMAVMTALPVIDVAGEAVALEAARNDRHLRALGVTVRKTVDTLIATRCLVGGHALLFSDRDFQPFVDHLGLRAA